MSILRARRIKPRASFGNDEVAKEVKLGDTVKVFNNSIYPSNYDVDIYHDSSIRSNRINAQEFFIYADLVGVFSIKIVMTTADKSTSISSNILTLTIIT